MSTDPNKKYKRPKRKTLATTNPETSTSKCIRENSETNPTDHLCPLLAKDSEWVDILQTNEPGPAALKNSAERGLSDDEEVLQLVDCEDGPQMKPLAIMFPGLLDKDPQTLNGMLNRAMSTTEVTRQLVDLGQKANFTFMKKADRLIPPDKKWLDSVTENSNSVGSFSSGLRLNTSLSSSYESSDKQTHTDTKFPKKKREPYPLSKLNHQLVFHESESQDEPNQNAESRGNFL